jgi:hypothetical protein
MAGALALPGALALHRAPARGAPARGAPARGAAVLGAAAMVLAGCGVGAPEIPDGFATTEVERLHVSHPADWTETEPEDTEEAAAYAAVSHEVDGTELARIDIRYRLTTAAAHTHAVGVATQGRHGILPDYEHEVSELSAAGAEDARRVDFSFTDAEVTGEPGPIHGVDAVLLDDDNWAHHVMVSWTDEALDPETVEDIIATVHLDT